MTTLKQAQKDPKALKKFIEEHNGDEIDDKDFERAIKAMTVQEKPKVVQEA